jgi:ketosteroid isomerase-like protein
MSSTDLIEKAKLTVDALLARPYASMTRSERVQHALDLVEMHFESENVDRIDECIRLYTDDAQWEAPARKVIYNGPEKIKNMYVSLFRACEDFEWTQIERWGTEDRVFDDSIATFRLAHNGFENAPFPLGTRVNIRLTHVFQIRDGRIAKETGYEIWQKAD